MTPEQIQRLIDALLKTGEFLATESFRIALQQVRAEIVGNYFEMALWFLGLVLSAVGLRLSYVKDGEWGDDFTFLLFLVGLIFGLVSLVVLILTASLTIKMTMNPEWYAIKLLLDNLIK